MVRSHPARNMAAGAALAASFAVSRLCAIPGTDKLRHVALAAGGVAAGRWALSRFGVRRAAWWAFAAMVAAGAALEVVQGAALVAGVPVLTGDAELADVACDVLGAAAGALVCQPGWALRSRTSRARRATSASTGPPASTASRSSRTTR